MTITRDLKPVNVGQKSYYGKAKVVEYYTNDNDDVCYKYQLVSYDTTVVTIAPFMDKLIVTITDMYSKTTTRHIKDFIIQQLGLVSWHRIHSEFKKGVHVWSF